MNGQSMRISKALPLLTLSPLLQCSACRSTPLLSQLDTLRPQSFPSSALSNFAGSSPSPRRFSTATSSLHSTTSFVYRIGASFSAKGRQFNPREDVYTFNASTSSVDEEEIYTGRPAAGQDAFFVSALGSSSPNGENVAFGVADGVGGWADSGIDSADFSHGLCHAMAMIAVEDGNGGGKRRRNGKEGRRMGPKELLEKAYRSVVEAEEIEGGGSTACVATGRADGVVVVANLGDSGFVQLRPSAVHHNSNPQTHAFNTPYQLSIVPPKVLQISKAFGNAPLSDMPSAADVSTHAVRHGDVLVFATDGVWDNLSPVDLLKVVSRKMMSSGAWVHEEGKSDVGVGLAQLTREGGISLGQGKGESSLQTQLAAAVVSEAKAASVDQRKDGPFAREVQKHYPAEGWHGGKVDDICVVAAVVVEEGRGEDRVGKPKL